MARIAVEQKALTDPRFRILAQLLGVTRQHALGCMLEVWNECQERGVYRLPGDVLDAIFERVDVGVLLVRSNLCSSDRYEGFRVRGTRGRTDWLKKRREDGRKGGRPKKTLGLTLGGDGKLRSANPLTPALALSEELQNPPTPHRASRSVPYSDGFTRAWAAFPHFEQRSKKRKAFEVWQRAGLEPQVDAVVLWIEAGKRGDDWMRDEGKFVPAMQVWLNGRDFSDPPAKRVRIEPVRPLAPWETANRLLTPEEIEARRQRELSQGVRA